MKDNKMCRAVQTVYLTNCISQQMKQEKKEWRESHYLDREEKNKDGGGREDIKENRWKKKRKACRKEKNDN